MLYIRVDMNDIIGTGHVMRCLSIAEAAKQQGIDTIFVLADQNAESFLREKGYEVIVLNSDWKDMDSEIELLIKIIVDRHVENLLIDSYQVTEIYLREIRNYTKVSYIDDLNSFVYPVDRVICYANYWSKFNYEETYSDFNLKTKFLLGCEYVPLRKEFQNCISKEISKRIKSVMILSGGTDRFHIIETLLESIHIESYDRIDVMCGRYNSNYEYLVGKYQDANQVHVYQGVDDLIEHMKAVDLVISAGGTTLYELCAVGTPTISYTLADNQLDNVKQFDDDGLIAYAGDIRWDNVCVNINDYIHGIYSNADERKKRSRNMQKLVDGYGAKRIVDTII